MLSLIKFELKKMLTRRVAVAANAGAIVMLVAVMALNVMQARAEGNTGEILSGPEAIAHRREVAEVRAGELTPERVAADIARYQEIAYERLNPEELAEMSDAAAYEAVAEAYDEATRLELYDPYYITLLKPWAVRGPGALPVRLPRYPRDGARLLRRPGGQPAGLPRRGDGRGVGLLAGRTRVLDREGGRRG